MELTRNQLKQRDIAWELGLKQPVIQRAVALNRQMAALEVDDAYQPMTGPPDDHGRFRRHLHPRYRFEPLSESGAAE